MTDTIQTSVEAMEAEVLPNAGMSPCVDHLPKTAEMKPLPPAIANQPIEDKSPAQWAYERVILYIKNFEERLDNTHEVAMGFAGSQGGAMRIDGLGYFAPDMITFYGRDEDGLRTQLVQHVSQLNVMLRALPKAPEQEEPRRIGFRLVADLGPREKPAGSDTARKRVTAPKE